MIIVYQFTKKYYMRHIFTFVFIYIITTVSYGQNSFKIVDHQNNVSIPFNFVNNLIILKTTVNNQELNLVFDTGVKQTVLINMQNNDSLDYKNHSKIVFSGMGNENKKVVSLKSTNNHISLNDKIVNNNATFYIISNFEFEFSENIGITINGFIGGELINNHQVKIDYKNKLMTFYPSNSLTGKELSKYRSYPLNIFKGKPYITTNIVFEKKQKPQKIQLLIDTGNSDALWIFNTDKIHIPKNKKSINDYMGLGLSGSIEGKRIKSHLFSFDKKFKFKGIYTALPDSIYFSGFIRNDVDGMIGNEVLNRFFIIFDYPNKKVYLKKYRRNYRKGFYYNDSGIYLAYNGKIPVKYKSLKTSYRIINQNSSTNSALIVSSSAYTYKYKLADRIVINYVRKDSPGAKAGLLKGDILLKINGNSVYQYKLEELDKKFFYKKSKRIDFLVERDGLKLEISVFNKELF